MSNVSNIADALTSELENQAPKILEVLWICNGFTAIVFASRIFSRWKITSNIGLEDWILTFSMVSSVTTVLNLYLPTNADYWNLDKMLSLAYAGIISKLTQIRVGRNPDGTELEELETIPKLLLTEQIIADMLGLLPKAAIVLMLMKLMGPTSRGKWILYGVLGSLLPLAIVWCFMTGFQCTDLEGLWNPGVRDACSLSTAATGFAVFASGTGSSCGRLDWGIVSNVTLAWSALLDVVLALFPIYIVWDLQVRLGKKIGICCVMGLGIVWVANLAVIVVY